LATGIDAQARKGDPVMSENRANKKILLVDDSETVLMLERMILKGSSYELVSAKDGKEGVAKALALKPDLILMDVIMPEMDGFEALKVLRRNIETRSIPILIVTTKGEEQSMETGYVVGCSDYITKPIDSLELLTKIQNFLGDLGIQSCR
jgi:CheY-like chemotaxis protein